MLEALKRLLSGSPEDEAAAARDELRLAVAVLLHEARSADHREGDVESAAAERALAEIFRLGAPEAAALLARGKAAAVELHSFFRPVSVVKREMGLDERIRLVEHLWRVVYAENGLDRDEDHYVRKISDLLYVPHVQCMLARNKARG